YPLERPLAEDEPRPTGCGPGCPARDAEWWERLEAEREALAQGRAGVLLGGRAQDGPRREVIERRGGAAGAGRAALATSGEPVLAVCADASRRARLASSAADPRRFGAAAPRIACGRCGSDALDSALGVSQEEPAAAGLVLTDWHALARRPDAA